MRSSFLSSLVFKVFFGLCLISSLTAGLLLPNLLTITKVIIKPNAHSLVIGQLKGESLLLINQQALKQEIWLNNPVLEKVNLKKSYPHTLLINFQLSKPVAQLESFNKFYLLTKTGKITSITNSSPKKLPIIKSFQRLRYYEGKQGQSISNPDILYALEAAKLIPQYGIDFEYLEISKPFQLKIVGKETVSYLNTKKQIAKNLEIVQNIIVTLKKKGQVPKVVNLFFEKAAYTL
jgi:hypothetical protein